MVRERVRRGAGRRRRDVQDGAGPARPLPRAVADDHSGEELLAVVFSAVAAAGYEVVPGVPLKTAPKGFPKDHPRVEPPRARGIVVWKSWPPAPWLGTSKAKSRIAGVLCVCMPLNQWLDVGESTVAARPPGP